MTRIRGTADDANPKYALIERERRWLVNPVTRPPLDTLPSVLIEDRYIRGTRLRLRRMSDSSGAVCKLTKKYESADPLARAIVTAYLAPDEHSVFAALPADPLVKRRYRLQYDGGTWSVDRFEGALEGLELLEIEAAEEEALRRLAPPDWACAEVSLDGRYDGASLAARGPPGKEIYGDDSSR